MADTKSPESPDESFDKGFGGESSESFTDPWSRQFGARRRHRHPFVEQVLGRLSRSVRIEAEGAEPWYATLEHAEWADDGDHISCRFVVARSPRLSSWADPFSTAFSPFMRRSHLREDGYAEAVYDYGDGQTTRADEFTLYYSFTSDLSIDLNFTLFNEFLVLQLKDLEREPRSLQEQSQPG